MAIAIIAPRQSSAEQTSAPATIHVAACSLEFDLRADYKITRHKHTQDEPSGDQGRQCSFDIFKAKLDPAQRGECKDKDEGGERPNDVCDWMLSTGGPTTRNR
ncbi:hypothetical protein G7048_02585 [Diaphorobacter sp. HDW4B]|uniref:hypothetical protein n=1 Tax=Diaphorobacter sp. HDW4B TaxID=2714925 RepID=UPI001409FA59|nr:hypothetical protein [Diaphorobacter sp. HDW4B]QIL69364.1 hypothetical protein G7048_02585 [Diaphorobacter sp. HDW4B]